MKLTELLDTPPIEYDPDLTGPVSYSMRFKTKNGQRVGTFIKLMGTDLYDLVFAVDGELSVTGKGEVGEIFSTVIDFIKQTLAKLPVDAQVRFTSDDSSRTKFYERVLKLKIKPPYSYNIYPQDDHAVFYITKEDDE